MKSSFLLSIAILLLTLACTRTSPSAQQTEPTPPPPAEPMPEKVQSLSFGTPVFKASGNEPFWSLQMDENHTLMLKSIDDHQFKLTAPVTETTRVNDANATKLSASLPDKKMTVMLIENGCQDNMSGKKSSHALQVVVKDINTKETVLYKGCGEFLNEYLVNNNWELESINNRKIADLPIEKAPTLNINLLEKKVNGFTGCNTFFGAVEIEKGRLKFGNIGQTKKACKDNTTEAAYMSLLNSKTQKHSITKEGKLFIKDGKQYFVFKPIN